MCRCTGAMACSACVEGPCGLKPMVSQSVPAGEGEEGSGYFVVLLPPMSMARTAGDGRIRGTNPCQIRTRLYNFPNPVIPRQLPCPTDAADGRVGPIPDIQTYASWTLRALRFGSMGLVPTTNPSWCFAPCPVSRAAGSIFLFTRNCSHSHRLHRVVCWAGQAPGQA